MYLKREKKNTRIIKFGTLVNMIELNEFLRNSTCSYMLHSEVIQIKAIEIMTQI